MAYCSNCGHRLVDGAKFCFECGRKINLSSVVQGEQRKTTYEGEIRKCPNCGDIIDPYEIVCDVCGFEIRGRKTTSVVHELTLKLEQTSNAEKRNELIRTFYIPNTKEDISEFFILAISNLETNTECREAWAAKLEQAYQKARIAFGKVDEFNYFEELYCKSQKIIRKKRVFFAVVNMIARSRKLQALILGIVSVSLMIVGFAVEKVFILSIVGMILFLLSLCYLLGGFDERKNS